MSEPNPTPAIRLGRGTIVAGYRPQCCLGRGWEGTSYLATELRSGVPRRLKFYRIDGLHELPRVGHIAATFERLGSTEAVPRYHHMGLWKRSRRETIPFLAFDYIEGRALTGLLAGGRWHRRWTDVIALTLLAAIARKLAAVHKLGYAVGDFGEGANILVTRNYNPVWCDLGTGLPGEPNHDRDSDLGEFFTILDRLAEHEPASLLVRRAAKRLARFRDGEVGGGTLDKVACRIEAVLDNPGR